MKFRSKLRFSTYLLMLLPLLSQGNIPKKNTLIIPYGRNSHIDFDLASGKFMVYNGNMPLFLNAACSYIINGVKSGGVSGKICQYTRKPVSNGFGRGYKTIITLSKSPAARVEEIFYTYPGNEFFMTEVEITGKNLASNSIVPFSGSLSPLQGSWRSLFVPFDNDTFISYDSKAIKPPLNNASSEVSVIYDDISRHGFVVGSVEHETWKTGVEANWRSNNDNRLLVRAGFTDEHITRDHIGHGIVRGDTIRSPKIFAGYFTDWRTGMEEYGKANKIAEPPFIYKWTRPTPVGWNSWGVIQDKLTFNKAVKVANFFADSLKAFRTGGTAFIDLDSYWDKMLKGPGDYSQLKAFVDSCRSKGLEPGVYWAPFTDWGWNSGPGRKVEGSNYNYGELWTKVGTGYHDIDGARAIDPTHPGTRQRIDYFIGKLKACGFRMIKIDFLGHATAESTHFYDTTVTTGMQAYRKGMEYLINKLGNQMLVYAAISPSLATGRYVHSRRIACDAFKTIDQTRYTLNSLTYGWWQTYLYKYLDADHVVLSTEPEGANRARFLSSVITGTCFTGDDFSTHGPWSERSRQLYQNPEILAITKNGKAFKPVDAAAGTGAAEIFTRKIGNSYYLAVFNYGGSAKSYKIDLKKLDISNTSEIARDLLSQRSSKITGLLNINLPAADATIIKLTPNKQ